MTWEEFEIEAKKSPIYTSSVYKDRITFMLPYNNAYMCFTKDGTISTFGNCPDCEQEVEVIISELQTVDEMYKAAQVLEFLS